jgi:hypothetical protein
VNHKPRQAAAPGSSLAGRYRVRADSQSLQLRRDSPPLEMNFSGVRSHDLPAGMRQLRLAEMTVDAGGESFRLHTDRQTYRVVARGVQVHERMALSAIAPALPRYRWQRRLLWTVLLAIARFDWGQRLIRRVRRRRSRDAAPSSP